MNQTLARLLRLTLVTGRREADPRSLVELAEKSFDGGATALQLREKNITDREYYEEALAMRDLCRARGRPLIINARLDIALAAAADGLHLGRHDLPAAAAAGLLPRNKILGVSVGNAAQARAALAAGADYLGVGAMFPTGSKDDAVPISPEDILAILALGAPTVAIGGLTAARAPEVWAMGFTGLAVISALTQAHNPAQAAADLLSAS